MPVSVAYELSWDQSLPAWWPQGMLYCSVKDLSLAIGTCACMRVLGYYLAMIVSYFTRHYFYLMWLVNNSSMKTSHGEWFAASLYISVLAIFTFVDRATKSQCSLVPRPQIPSLLFIVVCLVCRYCISSKSRHTLKSCRLEMSPHVFCNSSAILEISPHGKGSPAIYICAHALYVHTNRLIIEAVYACACRSLALK